MSKEDELKLKEEELKNEIKEFNLEKERLKEAMASTLMDFKNQQISLRQSLAQFQPLLKP